MTDEPTEREAPSPPRPTGEELAKLIASMAAHRDGIFARMIRAPVEYVTECRALIEERDKLNRCPIANGLEHAPPTPLDFMVVRLWYTVEALVTKTMERRALEMAQEIQRNGPDTETTPAPERPGNN